MHPTEQDYLILAAEVLNAEGEPEDLKKDLEVNYLARAIDIAGDRLGYSGEEIFGDTFGFFVKAVIDQFKGVTLSRLRKDLKEALQKFQAAGGRGPELADRVDVLSIITAIRHRLGDWPGPREWRPKR